ncbi:efflux transporter outer membrane subunit [Hellea balneolensis]|uniref:efflux transporter outer membrane subunit n=1 Tax=Hellea balneolensis TaxID=287478 RepID=UPI000401540C|nr:efflux transporter outer membrane subunit [Hellea balneolensis]
MRFTILLSASVIGLSGCASLNSLSKIKPEPTPVAAQQVTPTAPIWDEAAPEDLPTTDWVGSFSDATLTQLVSEALDANTNIRSAAARVDAAMQRARIAKADKLPAVNASSSYTRTQTNLPFQTPTNIDLGVTATWEADLWGRIKDGVNASNFELGATQADYAGARLSIAGQVTQAWFDLIEARLLTELSERDVDTQERALRLTQRRFEGGVTGSSDVRLARSSVANAQALQASREQRLSSITRQLEVLLRRYPAEEIQAAADLPVLPPLSGAGTPGYVLRKRPDILALEQRLKAQGLQIDIARKNLLPTLSLRGTTSLGATSFEELFDIDALVLRLVASAAMPIFQGGRLKANVAQQEALLRQQLESYAGAALTAYLEVENALDGEQRLYERELALRTSLDEAREAENRLELRYTEGLATILQLLDAQSRRLSAEGQLIGARKERLANRVRMHIALGGGLETDGVFASYNAASAAP